MLNFTDIFWTRSIQIPDQFYHHHLHVDLSSHHLHNLYNMKCFKYKPTKSPTNTSTTRTGSPYSASPGELGRKQ